MNDCQKWQLIFCVHAFFQLQNEKAKLEQELRDLNERRESQLKENQDLRAEIEGLRYTDTLTINGGCTLYVPVRSCFEAVVSITRGI